MAARILFFDSGMGGITIYDEVRKLLPNHQYLYAFDNEYFPYSEKNEATIIERVVNICKKIHRQYPLDLIIIACNTASTVVLPKLREIFDIPIIGTVPAVKPASMQSKNHKIGILATVGTIQREYLQNLIDNFASDCEVFKLGSTELVNIAETKFYGEPINIEDIKNSVAQWLDKDLDVIVLGCTHFPIIKQELQQIFPNAKLIDSGKAIAKRAELLLSDVINLEQTKLTTENIAFATTEVANYQQLQSVLLEHNIQKLLILE